MWRRWPGSELTAEEEALFAAQLGRIVDYIDQLDRFRGRGAEQSARNDPGLAHDEPVPGLPLALVLANAAARNRPLRRRSASARYG